VAVEFLSPGVFGIEVAPTRAQEGISPAKMGIIGWTERGPVNTPIEVRSVEEFTTYFGPINERGLTAISMRAFFGTGGQRAWVVRVVPSDATEATVDIDSPAKWTFTANGAGEWGNDLVIQVEGNRNFLDRTVGAEAWTKFDLKVLQPTAFDPSILGAAETYEAIQFTDPLASDFVLAAMSDTRDPSLLVTVVQGLGGSPDGLDRVAVEDLQIGTGNGVQTQFVGTFAGVPVLDNTLRIVAAEVAVNDQDQSTGAASGPNTLFTNPGVGAPHNLATTPITTALPIIPGSVSILIDIGAGPVAQTDNGLGAFPITAQLPAGGTINYNTGVLTGTTASLLANSSITESHTQSDVTPAITGSAATFQFTLPTAPVLDGSLKVFAARATAVSNEVVAVTGAINGANTVYTVAPGALSDKVHRETAIFRLKYAAVGSSTGPNNLFTVGGVDATHDLSTTPVTLGLPIHPGTLVINVTDGGGTPQTITDDGAGNLVGSGGVLPGGGTVDYDTGDLTGVTALLDALSTVDETHNTSSIITKTSTGDNLQLLAPLAGAVTTGTISLVDNVTTPTDSGPLSFTTTAAPLTGTLFYLDFVRLMVVNSNVAGVLTGDIGVGTNTANFTTGAVNVTFAANVRRGITIDADYQTGQIVTDDGLGNLVGDVDAAGNNTINYETGEYDVTFNLPPVNAQAVLANYTQMPRVVQFQLAGGSNGTAVVRAVISDPALEDDRDGIYAFDDVEDPLNIVVPDFEGSLFVQADIVDYCEARNTRFAILGFANGTTKEEAIKYVLVDQAFDTKVAAIYWPNIYFVNEVSQRPELIPVTPFIAGVYAKTAFNKNVGKSPGGIEDGALDANGTVGPEFGNLINDIRVRDDLYQSRINPLYNSDATGFVVWGVRSLSTEFRWRYVNARLLHNYLMDAINRQLQWAVFENNGPQLWIKIETALKGFMGSLFRQGYFAGVSESQGFFVVCNASNNNQSTVNEGKVIIDVGFSPFKPAEFVIFRLSQPASTITV
jgi:phage tail sheath protein FI